MWACKWKFNLAVFALAVVSFFVGCGGNEVAVDFGKCDCFAIKEFSVTPLTKFVEADDKAVLKLVVDALDSTGHRSKARFSLQCSLYRYLPRTADNKGELVQSWRPISLDAAAENNEYWNDYLRSYEFELGLDDLPGEQWYLVEIACQIPSGNRLFYEFMLKTP